MKKKEENAAFSEQVKDTLRAAFRELREKVTIEVFTGEKPSPLDTLSVELLKTFAELTDKIDQHVYTLKSEQARLRGVNRTPTILISPEKYKIRLIGAPAGEEGRTLIMSILLASNGASILPEFAIKRLMDLKEPRLVQVFVSPTCPYCPQQALQAVSAAIALPDLVTTEIIEMYENRDYVDKYHIISVPFTVINEHPIGTGVSPHLNFVEEMIILTSAEKIAAPVEGETMEVDVIVVGGGPGGLTAGIYTGRSGLKTVILEKATVGGQILITPIVENYPGYSRIGGRTLVDLMYQQALQYANISEGEEVTDVEKSDDSFAVKTNRRLYKAKALILVTGAQSRKLGAPGEMELYGRGVSYCATCDGYFYKDGGKVIVVGGGSTALTDALYLNSIGADVTLVHWRDTLRAEKFLRDSIAERKIPILWNTTVRGIKGEHSVSSVQLENMKDGGVTEMSVEGIFVAVGYEPSNTIAKMLGLELDNEGYIKADSRQRTNVRLVYAAGDVTGGSKQIASAVGQGATAAISAFEDIASPYWIEKEEKAVSG